MIYKYFSNLSHWKHIVVNFLKQYLFTCPSSINIMDDYYYFILLIGIEFGIKLGLELGTVFYY